MGDRFLTGIKVIDLGSFVAAPAAATVMADYGADVVKIEPPEGDAYRRLLATAPTDYFWLLTSRGKRSLAVDLKSPQGDEIVTRLVSQADVFVTNFRDGLLEKLNVTYETMKRHNPRLIYAHMSGYGRAGPEAGRPAFDTTAWWGRSGLQEFTRAIGEPPIISAPGMGDHATAMSLFGAIMAALYRRERTGEGGYVSTSLTANGVWSNGMILQAMLGGDDWSTLKHEGQRPRQPLLTIYRTRDDRWIQLSLLNPAREWPLFAEAMECQQWLGDPRYLTPVERLENHAALESEIGESIGRLDLVEFRERMDARSLTYGYAARNVELVDDPQLVENGMLIATDETEGPYTRTISNPIHIEGEQKRTPTRAPVIGQHSVAVLRDFGFSSEEIEGWLHEGVVVQP